MRKPQLEQDIYNDVILLRSCRLHYSLTCPITKYSIMIRMFKHEFGGELK